MPLNEAYAAGDELPAADINDIAAVINATCPIGKVIDFFGVESQVPNGSLLCNADTVGNAFSSATARANADMEQIFTHLWTVHDTDGTLVIQDSSGTPTAKGASAAADWAANRRITLPDLRGRVLAGKDDMGGTPAGIVTDAEADKAGGEFGDETHTLTEAELATHDHTITTDFYSNGGGAGSSFHLEGPSTGATQVPSMDTAGSDSPHNNMQPTTFVNKIIWTGSTW